MSELIAIGDWLKTSLLGILLVGVAGSLVAVWLQRYLGPPLARLLMRPLNYVRKEKLWRHWRSGAVYAHTEADPTNRKLIYYVARHLARLVLAVASFGLTTILFAVVVASRSDVLLTYGTFVLSMLAFLSAYWAKAEYDYIEINFIAEWQGTGIVPKIPDFKSLKREGSPGKTATHGPAKKS